MSPIHDETRARWNALPPEQFSKVVLKGVVREKIKLASLIIHVYAQIIHQFPATASMRVTYADGNAKAETRLREIFLNMRACIADAQDVMDGDTRTLPASYTTEEYVLSLVNEVRHYMRPVDRWTQAICTTTQVGDVKLPGFKGKTIGVIGEEIARSLTEIALLLDFAESYVEKRYMENATPIPTRAALQQALRLRSGG